MQATSIASRQSSTNGQYGSARDAESTMQSQHEDEKGPQSGTDRQRAMIPRETRGRPRFSRVMRCNKTRSSGASSLRLIESLFANQAVTLDMRITAIMSTYAAPQRPHSRSTAT